MIDSKFPLEGFEALRGADERRGAQSGDGAGAQPTCSKHVNDIAEKYLIPGEVQTPGHHVRAVGIDLCRAA